MPTPAQHRKQIDLILPKISAVVGCPVGLYRMTPHSTNYLRLDVYDPTDPQAEQRKTALDPYYSTPYSGFRSFMIAEPSEKKWNGIGTVFTQFNISPFPGLCAAGISHGTIVSPNFRNRGVNTLALQLRIAIAGACNYTILMCSDRANSVFSIQTLKRAGFLQMHQLVNKRTENDVRIFYKEL
jgi:hypothetical protein